MYLHSGLCTCTCNYTGGFAHVQCHALSQCFAHVHVMHLHSIRILNMYMHLHPILNMYTLLHSVRNMYMHLLLPAKTELQSQLKVGAGLPRAEHVSDCPGGSSKSLLLLSLCWLNAAMAVCLTASAATHIRTCTCTCICQLRRKSSGHAHLGAAMVRVTSHHAHLWKAGVRHGVIHPCTQLG